MLELIRRRLQLLDDLPERASVDALKNRSRFFWPFPSQQPQALAMDLKENRAEFCLEQLASFGSEAECAIHVVNRVHRRMRVGHELCAASEGLERPPMIRADRLRASARCPDKRSTRSGHPPACDAPRQTLSMRRRSLASAAVSPQRRLQARPASRSPGGPARFGALRTAHHAPRKLS